MWHLDSSQSRTPGVTKGLHGPRGAEHRGTRPRQQTVRGGRKARGQFPKIRAAGRTHTPRGELRFTCEFPQGGDEGSSPNGTSHPRARG